jgi:hypothetical protein
MSIEWSQPGSEDFGLRKKLQVTLEVELAILESLLESVDELAAKNFPQHFLWKQSSFRVSESSGCDRARGRRQERHNGHADEL